MSSFNTSQFNSQAVGSDPPYAIDFAERLLGCLPNNYVDTALNQDFLTRLFTPSAEKLTILNETFDRLYTYVNPFTAPLDWVQWITTEWLSWTLIPAGYPEARQRTLLAHLTADLDGSGRGYHYQRRYTPQGIRNLLLEFGIHGIVTDQPLYAGDFVGNGFLGSIYPAQIGANSPLNVSVLVEYYDPEVIAQHIYLGGFLGTRAPYVQDPGQDLGAFNTGEAGQQQVGGDPPPVSIAPGSIYVYQPPQLVTNDFVMRLLDWERAAGVKFTVQFQTASYRSSIETIVLS
jgi:hypothetical protein